MNTRNVEELLIFPPGWSTSSPYLSVPLLTSYLCNNGIETLGIDLNIRIINSILKDKCIDSSIIQIYRLLENNLSEEHEKELLLALDLYKVIKGRIDQTIYYLRNNVVEPAKMVEINRIIDAAFRIYSAPYFPGRIFEGALVYTNEFVLDNVLEPKKFRIVETLTELQEKVDCKSQNPYWPFLERFVSKLDLDKIKVIGLSICGYSQLISALSIASLIKKRSNKTIIMGGAIIPYIINALKENPDIFQYVDYIISGEGEKPLLELSKGIMNNTHVNNIEGIIYYNANERRLQINEKKSYVDLNELPPPIFNKSELRKYLVPPSDLALPLLGSKGCYWGKCAFCGINCNYDGKIRCKDVDVIIEEMRLLITRYNINNFRLVDNCIHPSFIKNISVGILENNIHISWQCMARFDPGFSPEIFEIAYQAGLKVISFGLETPNQSLLNKMNKGVNANDIPVILNACSHVGIFTHCFFMIGFPGEENLDPEELISFIRRNRYNIHSITFSNYRLESQSDVFNNMEKYNIELEKVPPCDYIVPNYQHKDFCNAILKLNYIRGEVADLESSEICFAGVEDMYVLGEIFNMRRGGLLKWQQIKIKVYQEFVSVVKNLNNNKEILRPLKFLNANKYYFILYDNSFFNYYIFDNKDSNKGLLNNCGDIQSLFSPNNITYMKYLYDALLRNIIIYL